MGELAIELYTNPSQVTPGRSRVEDVDVESPTDSRQEFSLPAADSGKHAWLFLTACFFIEGLVWGES
jgi:hypothetical protein